MVEYKTLPIAYKKKVNALINKLEVKKHPVVGNTNNLKWIIDRRKCIEQCIEEFDNLNTKRNYYVFMASICRDLGETKLNKYYCDKMYELKEKLMKVEEKNQLSANEYENWIPFNEIEKKREQLIKEFNEDKSNIKLNYQLLLVSLYTLQPPIRTEYCNMQIVNPKAKLDKDKNYLIKNKNDFTLFIQKDKVHKHYEPLKVKLDKQLSKIISESLNQFPREYVFSPETNNETGLSDSSYRDLLNSVFKPKKVGVDVYRSAYITHYYAEHKDISSRNELARLMRHSREQAEINYQKVTSDGKNYLGEHKVIKDGLIEV